MEKARGTSRAFELVFNAASLEPPLQAGRNTNQRRAGEASRTCSYSACRTGALGGIMTISGDAPPPGSEIKMRAWAIKRCRDVGVPGQVLAELMLVGCRDHIRLVLIGCNVDARLRRRLRAVIVLTRIARRAEGVGPAEMDAVHRR